MLEWFPLSVVRSNIFSPGYIGSNTLYGVMGTDGNYGTPVIGVTFMNKPMGLEYGVIAPFYNNKDMYGTGDALSVVTDDPFNEYGLFCTEFVAGTGYNVGTDWCPWHISIPGCRNRVRGGVYSEIMPLRRVLLVRVSGQWANATIADTGLGSNGSLIRNLGGLNTLFNAAGFYVRCTGNLLCQKLATTSNTASGGYWQIEMQFLVEPDEELANFRCGISNRSTVPTFAGLSNFSISYNWSPCSHNGFV